MFKQLILFFSLAASSLFANDLLFVGFDTGETNIWIQVIKSWENSPHVQTLTMATSSKVASAASIPHIAVEELGVSCPANQRLYELSFADLQKIDRLSASTLVTGMYSTPQRQIAELFHQKGSRVVAVWDNFSTYDKLPNDLVADVEKMILIADAVLVPSIDIARDLNARFHTDKAIVLGQPTLDLWEENVGQVDKTAALKKIGFQNKVPILTYISGYEEKGNGYNASFLAFVQSVRALKTPVQVIVQLHPRSDGSFEKKILSECSRFPPHVISDGKLLSTYEAVALADLGLCQRSTVAIQALFAGKRFMHIDVPDTPFSHFAIEKGLICQCLSAEAATQYITEHLHDLVDLSDLYAKAGIPTAATQRYRDYLHEDYSP